MTPAMFHNLFRHTIVQTAAMFMLLNLSACSGPALDLDSLTLFDLKLNSELTHDEVIHQLGRPDDERRTKRRLWRPPRRYMKYFQLGLELAFDTEGKDYDPLTERFFRAYIFLREESGYRAFTGRISHDIGGDWNLASLEKALGPPESTRKMGPELEWTYEAGNAFQRIFIADASSKNLKAVMILRRDRERPS